MPCRHVDTKRVSHLGAAADGSDGLTYYQCVDCGAEVPGLKCRHAQKKKVTLLSGLTFYECVECGEEIT